MYHNSVSFFGVMTPTTTELAKRHVDPCCFLLLAVEGTNTKQMAKKYFPGNYCMTILKGYIEFKKIHINCTRFVVILFKCGKQLPTFV
jgi:hypothetical protein